MRTFRPDAAGLRALAQFVQLLVVQLVALLVDGLQFGDGFV